MPHQSRPTRWLSASALVVVLLCSAFAASSPRQSSDLPAGEARTGSIEGRVFSSSSNTYVERVLVTVEGTSLETFTDADGIYRFTHVTAGAVRLKLFYTGLAPQTAAVAITAAQTTQLDITLGTATPKD